MPQTQLRVPKHEGETFESETVWITGHAYFGCIFKKCTMIVTNGPGTLNNCKIEDCTWRLEFNVSRFTLDTIAKIRSILDLIQGRGQDIGTSQVH